MTSDDAADLALVGGIAALVGGVVWLVWPKDAAGAVRSYAPAPAPREAPMSNAPMPAFLAAAPPAGAARERYFEAAVDAPTWVPVNLGSGVTINVSADVLKAQGIRIPLWPSTAQRVADRFNAMLPTKRLVDAIWRAGDVKLTPRSIQPHDGIGRNDLRMIADYDAMINAAVAGRGGLIVNGKKDLVVGRSIATPSGRLAVWIYGWLRSDGTPVQPVYGGHAATYVDASHGIRLVSRTAYVNGVPTPIEQLFASAQYAPLLNEGGTLTPEMLRYPTA